MASFVKILSFFFHLVLFSCLQIEARDRLFFNKVSRSNNNYHAEDPKIPLRDEQEAKHSPEVAARTTRAQKVAVDQPQEPSFSDNQYPGFGLFGSPEDTPATIDTSSNYVNGKNDNNINGDNFMYNIESDFNGNSRDDEIKQQGLSDTRFLENGRYFADLNNENKNSFNGYEAGGRGSTRNEGYDGMSGKRNEFDSFEEYEKYLQRTGYLPWYII